MSTNTGLAHTVISSRACLEDTPRCREIPPIVRIVLIQAAQHRRRGAISEEMFVAQVHRLEREELEPRGLELQVRDLSCGSTRFLVRAKSTGTVRDMIECASG